MATYVLYLVRTAHLDLKCGWEVFHKNNSMVKVMSPPNDYI